MNIRELKAFIKDLPDEAPVLIEGYESGFSDVDRIAFTPVCHHVRTDNYWDGPYQLPDPEIDVQEEPKALIMTRESL